jgi:hypothetical protein
MMDDSDIARLSFQVETQLLAVRRSTDRDSSGFIGRVRLLPNRLSSLTESAQQELRPPKLSFALPNSFLPLIGQIPVSCFDGRRVTGLGRRICKTTVPSDDWPLERMLTTRCRQLAAKLVRICGTPFDQVR